MTAKSVLMRPQGLRPWVRAPISYTTAVASTERTTAIKNAATVIILCFGCIICIRLNFHVRQHWSRENFS